MREQDRHDTHRSDGLIPTLVITTLVFFLLLGGALLLAREMPAIRERAVVSALERGDLAAARKRAARLSDPELAERYRCKCAYREAAALMEQGDWAAARNLLAGTGDYRDAAELVKECDYQRALALTREWNWTDAAALFRALGSYRDAAGQYDRCRYEQAMELAAEGQQAEAAMLFRELGDYEDSAVWLRSLALALTGLSDPEEAIASLQGLSREDLAVLATLAEKRDALPKDRLAVGFYHTLGLKADGSVLACGDDSFGQCQVGSWREIAAVAAGGWHSLGLRRDGTVVAVGRNTEGQCDTAGWTGVVQIATTDYASFGLCADGTVLCAGFDNAYELLDWTDIRQLCGGSYGLAALRSDGSVLASPHVPGADALEHLAGLALSSGYAAGLRADGRVSATAFSVEEWKNVLSLSAGTTALLALDANGRVLAHFFRTVDALDFSGIENAVAVAAGATHFAVLLHDGSVLVLGDNSHGQADTAGWKLF